jgi:O-antigen ligase
LVKRSRLIKRARALTRADIALASYGACCLLLGGASAAGALANAFLQLAGIAIIAAVSLAPPLDHSSRPGRGFWALLGILALIALVQFVPLPASLWSSLPGRAGIADGYTLMGIVPPWLPVTLAPDRAMGSVLALIPFVATLLLTTRATAEGRVAFAWVMIAVAAASIAVGAVQLFSGGRSALYFYQVTNRHDAVGFFANKNHLATLFLMTLPFIAALAAREEQSDRKQRLRRRPLFIGSFLFILFGAVLNNSSAGLALLVPCIGTAILIYRRGIGRPLPGYVAIGGAVVLAAALVFVSVGPFRGRFLDKAISTNNSSTRGTSISLTVKAARDFMPVGSGIGSFRHIYTAYEDPAVVTRDYINHAHSDWVEVALETGIMGIAALAAFALWLMARGRALWAGGKASGSMGRAALTSVVLLMLHSLVDYPARTAAILCVAGMALGLVAAPRAAAPSRSKAPPGEDEDQPATAARVFVGS